MAKKNNETISFDELNDGTAYRLWRTCGCGCGEVVKGVFAQGHDMKLKSQVLKGKK